MWLPGLVAFFPNLMENKVLVPYLEAFFGEIISLQVAILFFDIVKEEFNV